MRRPAVSLTLGLIAGIVCAHLPAAVALLCALSAVGALLLHRLLPPIPLGRVEAAAWHARTALVCIALGGLLGFVRVHLVSPPGAHDAGALVRAGPRKVALRGRVVDHPVEHVVQATGLRWWAFHVEAEAMITGSGSSPLEGRLLVYVSGYPASGELRYGDRLLLTGRLALARPATNPGEFDVRAHRAGQGVSACLSVREWNAVRVLSRGHGSAVQGAIYALRDRIGSLFERHVGEETAALGRSIVLGHRYALAEPVLDAFEHTGTYHLLAISGLHTAVVAGSALALFHLLRVPPRGAAILVLAITWLYCALAGGRPPVLRATIMVTVYLVARLVRREPDTLSALALAAVVILLWRPNELASAGFQLSFSAVLGLVLIAAPLASRCSTLLVRAARPGLLRRMARAGAVVAGLVIASFAAWAVTAPLTLYHFNVVAQAGLLVNVWAAALLWLALITSLGFVIVASLLPPLAAVAGVVTDRACGIFTGSIVGIAELPGTHAYLPAPGLLQVSLAYVLLGFAAYGLFRLRRRWKLTLAALLLAAAALVPPGPEPPPPGVAKLTLLDVSNGAAAFLETEGGVTLFDCGSTRLRPGRRFIAPALWDAGYRRVERIVLSHSDVDHVSGLVDILDRFAVGEVYVGVRFGRSRGGAELLRCLRERDVRLTTVRGPRCLELGGGVFAELLPLFPAAASPPPSDNDDSLVVRVCAPGGAILVPGDIQERGTRRLAQREADLGCDVAIVPHHGGANRRSADLVARVRPRLALVSARSNRPSGKTLDAFAAAGAEILETFNHGAITVVIRPEGILWHGFGPERCSGRLAVLANGPERPYTPRSRAP